MQLTEFTFFPLSQLGLKIRTFSNSVFPGLFQIVVTFIPRWHEACGNSENIMFRVLKKVIAVNPTATTMLTMLR